MVSPTNSESQLWQPTAHKEAYIGEESLRLLARLIARDILRRKASLNSDTWVSDSSLQPERLVTGKEGDPQP